MWEQTMPWMLEKGFSELKILSVKLERDAHVPNR